MRVLPLQREVACGQARLAKLLHQRYIEDAQLEGCMGLCPHQAARCALCLRRALFPTMAAVRLSYRSCRCSRLLADRRSLKSLCLSTFRKSSLSASSFPSNCSGSYLHNAE